jgi:hypothetical protein
MEETKTETPPYIAENFGNLLQSMQTMAEATKAFSRAMISFSQDLEQLAKMVAEIKAGQRLKAREGRK